MLIFLNFRCLWKNTQNKAGGGVGHGWRLWDCGREMFVACRLMQFVEHRLFLFLSDAKIVVSLYIDLKTNEKENWYQ